MLLYDHLITAIRPENVNRMAIVFILIKCPPLWSSGHSSWLQTQRSGFDFRRYQIFWEVVGLKLGPLNLVSTIEEVPERKSSGSGLEIREYGRRDPSRWPRGTLYPPNLELTSPTSGGRSAGKINSQTQTTEFFFLIRFVSLHGDSCKDDTTG
jgi:hypothetical protein